MRTTKRAVDIVLDSIDACLHHYKKRGMKVEVIELNPLRWKMFVQFIQEKQPTFDIEDKVYFKNLTVQLNRFLTEPMAWHFKKPTIKA